MKTKVFTSIDERLCFNIFTFAVHGQPMAVPEHMVLGTSANSKGAAASTAASAASSSSSNAPSHSSNDCAFAERIFAYARELKEAHDSGEAHPDHISFDERLFTEDSLRAFVRTCPREYVEFVGPRSFLQQRRLVDRVAVS